MCVYLLAEALWKAKRCVVTGQSIVHWIGNHSKKYERRSLQISCLHTSSLCG